MDEDPGPESGREAKVRELVRHCLKQAALVNYTRVSDYAKFDGLLSVCKNVAIKKKKKFLVFKLIQLQFAIKQKFPSVEEALKSFKYEILSILMISFSFLSIELLSLNKINA